MNRTLMLCTAATLVVGLSACDQLGIGGGRGGGNNAVAPAGNVAGNAVDANASGGKDPAAGGNSTADAGGTSGGPGASAAFNGQVTPAFLIGRWTDTGDCTKTIEFRDDGTFVTESGGGQWALNGTRLTFSSARTISADVSAPNANTIMLTHDDGTIGRSTRCTG